MPESAGDPVRSLGGARPRLQPESSVRRRAIIICKRTERKLGADGPAQRSFAKVLLRRSADRAENLL